MKSFSCLTIDEAPEVPGLYAWYPQLRVGPADWKLALENGRDKGEAACRALLHQHTSRFSRPPLRLEAKSSFSSRWEGELHDVTMDNLGLVSSDAEEQPPSRYEDGMPKLDETLTSEASREALLLALAQATPIWASPLYIGVATSLRSRLKQHVDQLFKWAELIAKRPPLREELRSKRELPNFAARASSLGFGPDNLVVYTFPFSNLGAAGGQGNLRVIAEAAEWFLNRWHRPLLGVR